MLYRLDIDGLESNILIKAMNTVLASSIVSEYLAHRGIEYEDYQLYPQSLSNISEYS